MSDRAEAIRKLMEGGWSRQDAKMLTFGHEAAFRPMKALAVEAPSDLTAFKERIAAMENGRCTERAVIVDATSPSGLEMMTHAEARYWAMINDPAPPTGDSEWLDTGFADAFVDGNMLEYKTAPYRSGYQSLLHDADLRIWCRRMTSKRRQIRLQAARRKRTRGWK